jgi:hypothetical protein
MSFEIQIQSIKTKVQYRICLFHYNYIKSRNAKGCEINCRLASPLGEVAPPVIIPFNL